MNNKFLAILSLSFVLLASCWQEINNKNNTENNTDNNQTSSQDSLEETKDNKIEEEENNSSTENLENNETVEEKPNLENNNNEKMDNKIEFNQTDKPQDGDLVAIMKTTNGTMKFRLFLEQAPKTVLNFAGLAQKGYYKDIIFHRVIKDFMIQWGDPTGTWTGWESFWGGDFEDEFSSDLSNIRWALSMANAGANTNSSQFFVVEKDALHLDNRHSVFGQVYEKSWLDTLDKIAKTKTNNDKPEKNIKIISVEIKKYNSGKLENVKLDIDTELKKIEEAKKQANKTREVKAGDKIAVHYTGTLEDGEKFDSSLDRGQPLEFTVWAGQMIKGFDAGVVGMKIGDKKKMTLKPEEAYGEYSEENIQEVPDTQLVQAGIPLEVGQEVPTQFGIFKIVSVDKKKKTAKIDFNHKLAGKTLIFDVEIVEFKN